MYICWWMNSLSSIPRNINRPDSKGNIDHIMHLSSSCLTRVGYLWVLASIAARSDELMGGLLVSATPLQAPWWRLIIPSAPKEWIVDPTLHNVRLRQKRRADRPYRMLNKRLCCPMSTCLSVETSSKGDTLHAASNKEKWTISRLVAVVHLWPRISSHASSATTMCTVFDRSYGQGVWEHDWFQPP